MAEPAVGTGVRRWWHSRFGASFARELLFVTALLAFYKYGRTLVSGESTKAVDHALTSRRPKRRYLLDIVSRAQKAVVAISPTAVNDAVLAAATTSK